MNLPNQLSLSRIFIVPLFLVCLLSEEMLGIEDPTVNGWMRVGALVLVVAVAITDWLDGVIARSQQLVTNLGKLLDPLADKIFVASALIGMVEMGLIPAWAVVIVIGREFLVTGLRMLAMEQGRVIAADRLGKQKTGWQLALILLGILLAALRDLLFAGEGFGGLSAESYWWGAESLIWIALGVTVGLTVMSGWNYTVSNRDLFRKGSL